MSEELDFEAEISSTFTVETLNVTEVDQLNKDAIQFDDVEAEDDTIEIQSNTKEVLKDADEIQSTCEEVKNYTIEIQSTNRDVKTDINITQLNTGESHSDAGEIQSDADEIQSDAGEIQSDVGEIQSDLGEIQSDLGEIQSDPGEIKSEVGEIQSEVGEIQSDTGEIEDGDNLEEGEIEDNAPTPNKNPEDTVCRFFKRGNCLYGSECRNLHVSNKVYNMFEPVLSNRSNLNSLPLQNAHVPVTFHPPPMLIMPDIESSWERGIKKAKVVMLNANFRKSSQEDIENDWNRCLEVAKQSIQQKTNLRRQSCDEVKPYYNSKYNELGKFREKDPENKIFKSSHQKSLFSYCNYKKESNCEKKLKSEVKQTPDHLKWVDPWQRSKSPRKRQSFSLSPSPSRKRSRKGSISSSSSSSSCFKRIYGSAHKSKSPKRFRSASRSTSVFSRSKKSSTFKKRSHSRGRSYSRSISRSPRKSRSKSSKKSCCSYSSSRTSSVCSDDCAQKKSNVKTIPVNKFVSKNEKHCITSEKSKDIYRSSSIKHSFKKASDRVSSPCHSDKSSSSDLSMSSLSYTSISSNGKSTLQTSHPKALDDGFSRSKIDKVPQARSRVVPKPEQGYQKSNTKVSDLKKVLSPDRKKLLMYKDTNTKTKCADTVTSQVSSLNKPVTLVPKPPATKKVTVQKPSKAALELLKYHSFGRKNNSASTLTKTSQEKTISPMPTEAAKPTATSKILQPKASEGALPKIPSDVQVKLQKSNDYAVMLKIKEAGSKRRLLLQQLQAIEDAIARKKQPLH